jgi:nitroimidazol reductase NimA-like FMN-containing flavoprotein (pyridoxamine 5'-phosphate oxidase superfamily)
MHLQALRERTAARKARVRTQSTALDLGAYGARDAQEERLLRPTRSLDVERPREARAARCLDGWPRLVYRLCHIWYFLVDQRAHKLTGMEEPSPRVSPLAALTTELSGPSVRLKRHPERGSNERERVFAIIDEALLAHVAFSADGTAMTLPTAHARIGDQLYLHGARANRMLHALFEAPRASATFTLLDGLVLARTAFHHSMNYRSAVVFGPAREVTDVDEKRLALRALIEHMTPGRMSELAEPTASELQQTFVICLSIEEASAKVRSGDPVDAPADYALEVWAGTLPLALTPSNPKPDPALRPGTPLSAAAQRYTLRSATTLSQP